MNADSLYKLRSFCLEHELLTSNHKCYVRKIFTTSERVGSEVLALLQKQVGNYGIFQAANTNLLQCTSQ